MRLLIKLISGILGIIGIILICQYDKGVEVLSYLGMVSSGFTLTLFIWTILNSIYEWILEQIEVFRSTYNDEEK